MNFPWNHILFQIPEHKPLDLQHDCKSRPSTYYGSCQNTYRASIVCSLECTTISVLLYKRKTDLPFWREPFFFPAHGSTVWKLRNFTGFSQKIRENNFTANALINWFDGKIFNWTRIFALSTLWDQRFLASWLNCYLDLSKCQQYY